MADKDPTKTKRKYQVRHDKTINRLHAMGATRIVLGEGAERLEVEFPERPPEYGELKGIDGGKPEKSYEEMSDEERDEEDKRALLWSTDENTAS